jgi:thioredoxin reductase (NADPH)
MREVIIVGSGPAGYTAGIYLGRGGKNPLLITGIAAQGGALMLTTYVENYPGHLNIAGPDLMQKMAEQAEQFGTELLTDDVVDFDISGDIKRITTSSGETFEAKALVLALGSEYRKLGLAGEAEYTGRGVSYCATCDGFFFRGKMVAIVGGGDTALEEALFLSDMAKKVYLIHRRSEFRANKRVQDKVRSKENIELVLDSAVAEIVADGQKVIGIKTKSTANPSNSPSSSASSLREIPLDGLFVAIGAVPNTSLLKGKLELDKDGFIRAKGTTSLTSVEGVFAGGNVIDNRYKQAVTAAAGGCKAALDAEEFLEMRRQA